ncbi:hypothetical protein RA272_30375, partial [Pseudomonas syringae pv. tagetis]|uniref:hypothetical protein n=1 Tax=Pseudomonas syringae group genomosp. 7 TaxID=251699 RepID=UPI00376FFBBB
MNVSEIQSSDCVTLASGADQLVVEMGEAVDSSGDLNVEIGAGGEQLSGTVEDGCGLVRVL